MTIAQRFNVGEPMPECPSVPKGRLTSLPQVMLLVGDTVLFEERLKFFLKGHLPVVRLLIFDVVDCLVLASTLAAPFPAPNVPKVCPYRQLHSCAIVRL